MKTESQHTPPEQNISYIAKLVKLDNQNFLFRLISLNFNDFTNTSDETENSRLILDCPHLYTYVIPWKYMAIPK